MIENEKDGQEMKQFVSNFHKYRYLLGQLVKKNIKLRYRRSYLGILWTLIEPLLTMIVLSVVFGALLGRDRTDPAFQGVPFPLYVLTGRLLYSFFSSSTNTAMKSIRNNSAMIRKVYVPKYIYPFSGVVSNFVIFLISLVVLFGVLLFFVLADMYHAPLNWHMLTSVIPLLNLFVLALGVGMILATLCVFFRDVEYLWSVVLMLVMYCSAIFYFVDQMSNSAQRLIKLNPLFGIIHNFRRTFFGQPFDEVLLLYTTGFAVVTLLVGLFAFYKKQDSFILHI